MSFKPLRYLNNSNIYSPSYFSKPFRLFLQETDIIDDVSATEDQACEDVVKSDESPYIIQEKDVLEKIRIVDEAKRKFSQQM